MAEKDQLAEIIEGCKNGETECFSQIIDIYADRCYGYFYRLSGDRTVSDDLLSELFIKLIEKINSCRTETFEAWLFITAANVFRDHLRAKLHRKKILKTRKEQLQSASTKVSAADKQAGDSLQAQLAKLDDDTKEAIVLRYYSQLSFKEIAKIRSEPIGTTLSKVHRGLKKLKELMQAEKNE